MSIENIIDYVIKTPQNTNPNVIRSLVKSEVDENTLQKAKEYTDSQRIAFIETETVEVLSDTTINLEMSEDGIAEGTSEKMISLTVGQTYSTVWDGVRYECVAQIFDGSVLIGNVGIIGLDDTGEPFALASSEFGITVISMSAGNHTLSITQETETIHPIDPKYLPEEWGGASSWNDLTDKPFGIDGVAVDVAKIDEALLESDEELFKFFEDNYGPYSELLGSFKVSDTAMRVQDVIGKKIILCDDGESFEITISEDMIHTLDDPEDPECPYSMLDMLFVIPKKLAVDDKTIEAGTYMTFDLLAEFGLTGGTIIIGEVVKLSSMFIESSPVTPISLAIDPIKLGAMSEIELNEFSKDAIISAIKEGKELLFDIPFNNNGYTCLVQVKFMLTSSTAPNNMMYYMLFGSIESSIGTGDTISIGPMVYYEDDIVANTVTLLYKPSGYFYDLQGSIVSAESGEVRVGGNIDCWDSGVAFITCNIVIRDADTILRLPKLTMHRYLLNDDKVHLTIENGFFASIPTGGTIHLCEFQDDVHDKNVWYLVLRQR